MAFNPKDNPLNGVYVLSQEKLEIEKEIGDGLFDALKNNDIEDFLKQLFENYEITRKEV